MDPSKSKTTQVSRGFTYNYYHVPSQDAKPAVLFCHGFPSYNKHWEKIATLLETEGYGVIVPDMLGYGGTDKPTETALYKHSAMCADVIDILDAESVGKAIAIGHDW